VTEPEVESALVEILELDQIADILDRDINAAGIVEILIYYNFARLRPEELAIIRFEESIIPAGVDILLTEAEVDQSQAFLPVADNYYSLFLEKE